MKSICKRLLIGGLFFFLVGCITERSSDLTKKKDKQLYIQNSVAAALEYLKQGDTKNSIRHINNVMEVDPKSSEAHNAMALLHRQMKDADSEEKHYKLAIRYNPQLSKARNNYAVFLFQQKRYKEALFQLEKASKDPAYESRALAFENMGRSYLGLNDTDQAEDSFKEALRIDSRQVRSYVELAQLNFSRGKLAIANQYLKQFGDLGRHNARSLWLGIQIERKLGGADALASYELALRNLFPDSAEFKAYSKSVTQNNTSSSWPNIELGEEVKSETLRLKKSNGVPMLPAEIDYMDISAPKLIRK